MIALVISDLHISEHRRDEYRLDFLYNLPELARELEANAVYILGDITHAKGEHSARLVNQIVDGMARLSKIISLIILRGNHDGYNPKDPFFKFLYNLGSIRFISLPTVIGKQMWLPHTNNYKRDWAKLNFNGINLILTHNTFHGARNENGRQLDGIPLSALPPKIPILSGDVHVPQKVANVMYVGAPYLINYGDDFNPRCLLLHDNGMPAIESVPLDLYSAQKRLIQASRSSWNTGKAKRGDIVRIEFRLLASECGQWNEFRELCSSWCEEHGFILDNVVPLLEADDMTQSEPTRVAPKSDQQIMQAYCRRNSIDEDTRKEGEALL